MKKLLTLLVLGSVALATHGAIQVGTSGFVENFSVYPPTTDWTTTFIGTADSTYGTAADLDTAVQGLAATSISTVLSNTTAASPTQIRWAIYSSANTGFLVTRPTGVGAVVLMATVQNAAGGTAHRLDVAYTLATTGTILTEQIPAHRVYYSLDGNPGNWVPVTGITTSAGAQATSIDLSATGWNDGAILYLLWADDNATGGTDNGWSIDNLSLTTDLSNIPLAVALNSPTNGIYTTSTLNPANLPVAAVTVGTTPATSVSFYTNGVLFFNDTTPPYSNTLANLPIGTYTIYARAANASETAFSATNTVVVRDEFVHYTGGVLTESFDEMGPAGTETPVGWYVGINPPINGTAVTVGDGSAGPNASILGWNYGLTGDSDRALGTAPTGADRSSVVRIQNNTASNIVSFELHYDGEVWRNYTNFQFGLTNEVSFDQGATWIINGPAFDALQPFLPVPGTAGAVNGNDPANRTNNVGGTVTPPSPVPPGGVIYIRWYDNNEGGTDGGMAVDNFSFQATAFSQATLFVDITAPVSGDRISTSCGTSTNVTVNANAAFFATNVTFVLDGTTTLNDASPPYSVTFANVGVGTHTVVATAQSTTSSIKTTNTFTVGAGPNVVFTSAVNNGSTGLVFAVGSAVTNHFTASDPSGIAGIEILLNGVNWYTTNINFSQIIVNDLLAGANTVTIRATNTCGLANQISYVLTGTNPPNTTVLVANGSTWKYSATGAEPAVDGSSRPWTDANYDDSAWLTGAGELGGGDAVTPPNTNPERTVIDIGPSGNRYHAVYFRHAFNVSNPSQYTGLVLRVLDDDGSAVYLNGTLLATFRMTNEVGVPITYADLAVSAESSDGTIYYSTNLASSVLVNGNNVLAVEVHQDAINSSDLSFDLMLWAEGGGAVFPKLTIVPADATHVTISWDANAAGYRLQSNTDISNRNGWVDVQTGITGAGQVTVSTTGTAKFYQLRNP